MIGVVLILGALVFDSLYALLDHVHYADMVAALQATPARQLGFAICATALSYVALMGYDASGLRYAGAQVPPTTVAISTVPSSRMRVMAACSPRFMPSNSRLK